MPKKAPITEPTTPANTRLISVHCNSNRTSSSISWPNFNNFSYISGQSILTFSNQLKCSKIIDLDSNLHCISSNKRGHLVAGLADGTVYVSINNMRDDHEIRGTFSLPPSEDDSCNNNTDSITNICINEYSTKIHCSNINSGFYYADLTSDEQWTSELNFRFISFNQPETHPKIKNSIVISSDSISLGYKISLSIFGLDNGRIAVFDGQKVVTILDHHHDDWVRSLHVKRSDTSRNEFKIVTGGQDKKVMICKVTYNQENSNFPVTSELLQVLEDHDKLVYTTKWVSNDFLLSTSMDGSMLIYKFEEDENKFIETAKVGQLHASNQHVGFWSADSVVLGCMADKENMEILIRATTYTGAFYQWKLDNNTGELTEMDISSLGGHTGRSKVTDICWSNCENFLLSCSSDQTTRGFTFNGRQFCRPQVHGYDLNRVAVLETGKFVSCSDEKELRVFEETGWFRKDYGKAVETSLAENEDVASTLEVSASMVDEDNFSDQELLEKLTGQLLENENLEPIATESNVERASQPILGLTNKDLNARTTQSIEIFTEERLSMDTLWPEIQKLYAHGNDVMTLAYNKNLKIIASACKAKKEVDAEICIWRIKNGNFMVTQKLGDHNLTVVDISFDDQNKGQKNLMASVGRDRSICVYEFSEEIDSYRLKVKLEKAHSRIIWSCKFLNGILFTASRDKTVSVWSVDENDSQLKNLTTVKFSQPITAIDAANFDNNNQTKLAIGLENGAMYLSNYPNFELKNLKKVGQHNGFLKRLRLNVSKESLASCSEDGQVRIYDVSGEV